MLETSKQSTLPLFSEDTSWLAVTSAALYRRIGRCSGALAGIAGATVDATASTMGAVVAVGGGLAPAAGEDATGGGLAAAAGGAAGGGLAPTPGGGALGGGLAPVAGGDALGGGLAPAAGGDAIGGGEARPA